MAKATQRQIVAEIVARTDVGHGQGPSWDDYFATVSGGEISAAVEKVYDGNSTFPEVLCAPAEIGDITVSRFFDPDNDIPRLARLRPLVGMTYYDLTIVTLNCELREVGSERVYPKVLLVGLTEPDGDASSGAPASFSLTFAVSQVSPAA